jgi:hypothetical protein
MASQNPNSLEKVGVGLACSVETFRGCNIQLVKKISGFNGLSTNKDGHVRKIEVKSMETNYKWIAISGLVAIDKLFFERDYWIYFVLLPQNYVVMTKGLPFVRRQLSLSANTDYVDALQDWMKATRRLTKQSGLKFLPKLQLKFPVGLDEIVKQLTTNPADTSWRGSVVEIWQNKGSWVNLYKEPDED